jgi:Lar family restriction alleviation protein
MAEKLKPCPFCGKRGVLFINEPEGVHWVYCESCEVQGTAWPTKKAAITAWNQRTAIEATLKHTEEGRVEMIQKLIEEEVAWRTNFPADGITGAAHTLALGIDLGLVEHPAAQEGHPKPCNLGPLCPYCEIERLTGLLEMEHGLVCARDKEIGELKERLQSQEPVADLLVYRHGEHVDDRTLEIRVREEHRVRLLQRIGRFPLYATPPDGEEADDDT